MVWITWWLGTDDSFPFSGSKQRPLHQMLGLICIMILQTSFDFECAYKSEYALSVGGGLLVRMVVIARHH